MTKIDYYFSVLSPFTYLAGNGVEQIAAKHNAQIVYKPLDLIGLFAKTGGLPPGQRHWSRQEYRLQELKRIASHTGLDLHIKPAHWPTDPLPASKAILATQHAGQNPGSLAHAFPRACWAQERNIGDQNVVDEILAENDISAQSFKTFLATSRRNLCQK